MEFGLGRSRFMLFGFLLGVVLLLGVAFFHPEALDSTDHADNTAGPPGQHRITALESLGMEKSSDCRSECATQASGGCGNSVDGAQNLRRGGGVGEQDGSCGERHDMEGDLADQRDVCGGHLEFRGEKDKVRNDQVKRRPDEKHEAESSESAKVSHHKGEKPELGNHGIDTLYSEHESDGLGLETQSSGELEGQSDAVIGLWRTEEHGHQLIEGNTVAIGAVSIMHSAFAVGYQEKESRLTMQGFRRQ